ncbi:GntR family transcriptional regulator [Vineibacter terrae]|nr:GntR family transcriptional regulator [Vineibacter terrae]
MYAMIRADIIAGRHPAGGHLREEQLAEAIGVSRTPVREALRRLAAEGLIKFVPNHGAFVNSWSADDLRKIFDLRALLESTAAGQAAPRMTPQAIDRLRELAAGMVELADHRAEGYLERISDLNRAFHDIIMKTADNERLSGSVVRTIEFPIVHRTFQRYRPADLRRSLNHHWELIDAFEARDAEWASAVMRAHVLAAKHVMLSRSPSAGEGDAAAAPRPPARRVKRPTGRL